MANGATLLKKAMQFAEEEDSVAGEAAKEFAEILAGYIEHKQFNSGDFDDDIISFLIIDPIKLNEMDDETITKFIRKCCKKNAMDVIKRFLQICTSPWFDVSYEKLLHIGAVAAKSGFKQEGAQVIHRASEKIKAEDQEGTQ